MTTTTRYRTPLRRLTTAADGGFGADADEDEAGDGSEVARLAATLKPFESGFESRQGSIRFDPVPDSCLFFEPFRTCSNHFGMLDIFHSFEAPTFNFAPWL